MGHHTDQTLVYKTCKTVDEDEGEGNDSIAIYNDYGKRIQPFRVRNVDDAEGIVSQSKSFGNLFASMKGTSFPGDGILDSIQFQNPLRSSDLKTKLSTALRGRGFTNERVPPGANVIVGNAIRNFTFDQDGNTVNGGLQNTQEGLMNISSSFGINGRQEKIRFFFAKKIEASTGSSPTFASAEQRGEPVRVSISSQYDSISISEKDSYVDGRTSNENFIAGTPAEKEFPYLVTPFATKIINKVFTSNSGTKFIKQVMEKILVTAGEEIATYDYDNTAIIFDIGGSFSMPSLSTWNPIFLFSNNQNLPFIPDNEEDDDDDDDDDGHDTDVTTDTEEEAEEEAEEEKETSQDPCPEAFNLPNAVEAQ
jgi:hypothetical protein